jgi:iron complex outermembrane receptor protein
MLLPSATATRPAILLIAILILTAELATAQEPTKPARPDSARRDSVQVLDEIIVTVTRTAEPLSRVPQAIGVVGPRDITLAQPTLGADEALNNIPGVYIQNRYNFSQGQRIVIRGAGARAPFGARGVKVLLDGVPQTLPDGQSQLTNVDYGLLDKVEVLRGPASSLYGNASGGVISLHSRAAGSELFAQSVRFQAGSYGMDKWQAISTARKGNFSGVLSLSRFTWDGFRQNSAADIGIYNIGLTWTPTQRSSLDLWVLLANSPTLQNPGALTYAEYNVNPDSAAAANIRRGAANDINQQQVSLTYQQHFVSHSGAINVSAFGLKRAVQSPLGTAPPGDQGADAPIAGVYVQIARQVGGARATGAYRPGTSWRSPLLTAGLDFQRMRDDRQNFRALRGVPTDSVLLDQVETVTEVGPFIQAHWTPTERVTVGAGARYDWVTFDVADNNLADGTDDTGSLPLSSPSGTAGVSYYITEAVTPYLNLASAFETPTTTELANRPSGGGGFNDAILPQKTLSAELGARGRLATWLDYSVAGFISRVRDAIVPFRDLNGRTYYTNAGKLSNNGLELGVTAAPVKQFSASLSFTYANYRFSDYVVVNGTTADTLDGNMVPGVPRFFTRIGLRSQPGLGFVVDLDQTLSSSLTADDRNSIWVENWGAGVTNLRVSWSKQWRDVSFLPYVGLANLFDRKYIGAVTVNGFGGRVLEPSPRQNFYIGAEIGFKTRT